MSESNPSNSAGGGSSPRQTPLAAYIAAVADGEEVPAEIREQIECCPQKSGAVVETRTTCEVMRCCLQRALGPDDDTRSNLIRFVETTGNLKPGAAPGSRPLPRVGGLRPVWLASVGTAAAVLIAVLVVFVGQKQDAVAMDALRKIDTVDRSLRWRIADEAVGQPSAYEQMIRNFQKCPICDFVDSIPAPTRCDIRLLGATNSIDLDGHMVVTMLYEGRHLPSEADGGNSATADDPASGNGDDSSASDDGDKWRFVLFIMRVETEREVTDMFASATRVVTADSPDETFFVCEQDGRSCIAWHDPSVSAGYILSADLDDLPRPHRLIDVAGWFRHTDRRYSLSDEDASGSN